MTMVSTPALSSMSQDVLVAAVAVLVTVRKSLAEIPAIKFPIPETRTVVFSSFLIIAFVAVIKAITTTAILPAFLNAIIVAGVQCGLTKLEPAAIGTITIPITATPVVVVVGSALVTPPIVIVMPASFDLTLTLRFFCRAPASPLIVVAVAIMILMAFVFVPAAIARVVPVYKNEI